MSRAFALAVAVGLVLAPAVARAQAPIPPQLPAAPSAPPPVAPAPAVVAPAPPLLVAPAPPVNPADGECTTTTTTTTRCTGAAAPYAAHPAPPTIIVPAPAPAPMQMLDAPTLVPCPIVLPSGWSLHQDPDGSWWRVRKHRGVAGVWAPGLTLWMVSYFAGMMAGLADGAPEATFPIAGSFVAAAFSESSPAAALWAVDGLAQLGGLVMFIVGASLDGNKLERLPVAVTPTSFYGGGAGVALSGRF